MAAGEARSRASVLIDLVALGIDDPDVGAIGRYALNIGIGGQRSSGPGAEQAAAGVVDIDGLVGIDDPDFVAGYGAGSAAGGRVAAIDGVILDGSAAGGVFVGAIGAAVVDDVEFCGRNFVVDDGADPLAIGNCATDRVRKDYAKRFARFRDRPLYHHFHDSILRESVVAAAGTSYGGLFLKQRQRRRR